MTAPCTEATVFSKGFLLKVIIVGARFHEVVEKPDEHPPDQQDGRVVGDELLPVSLPASSSLSSREPLPLCSALPVTPSCGSM